jgi:hypothetical protein
MKHVAFVLTVFLLFFINDFSLAGSIQKNLVLSASSIEKIDIDCGAGFLKVEGVKNLNDIELKAEIVIEGMNEDEIEKYCQKYGKLSLEQKGQRALITSKLEKSYFSIRNAHMNLTIRVPQTIDLSVDDGSGFIEISNISGDVFIDDGSGEVDVQNISGNLDIDDGSGEITVGNITGDVIIDDGSGTLRITNVEGNVKINDGSGSIYIDGVKKDVTIDEAGSGGLTIRNVDGEVRTDN